MSARTKLNSVCFGGSFLVAAFFGLASQSFLVFLFTFFAIVGVLTAAGAIRDKRG